MEVTNRALYRSKQQGRNRVTQARREDIIWDFALADADWYTNLFRDLMAAESSELAALVSRLRSALEDGYEQDRPELGQASRSTRQRDRRP